MADWKRERERVLREARRVVVKVGSAVLAGPDGLDAAVIDSLAEQISQLHGEGRDVVFVSSGAVAAGRAVLRHEAEPAGMPDRQAASAVGQSRLMHAYDQAFAERAKVTAQILLTRDDLNSRRRYLNARNTFRTLLAWRAIPIVNENDTVMVEELTELNFGDNDQLAALLLNLVEADLFVNLTSAAGVYTKNPDTCPDAEPLECVADVDALDLQALCGGKSSLGTGGMYSKLKAARRAAQIGVPTLILPGREPGALLRAFSTGASGTWIAPCAHTISAKKFWLAYNTAPSGVIRVDAGAVRALEERHTSLLPAGITAVEGAFQRGAPVRIEGPDGRVLGMGLSNYRAVDLKRIQGLKTGEVAGVLGYCYDEAVHRDNMHLDGLL
ncbi:MAG: glutamate 5-kinase [Desulfovibrionaceae bacterium]|nr:glutamate 5-kinase [Desulfovibrionaceae bacterium]